MRELTPYERQNDITSNQKIHSIQSDNNIWKILLWCNERFDDCEVQDLQKFKTDNTTKITFKTNILFLNRGSPKRTVAVSLNAWNTLKIPFLRLHIHIHHRITHYTTHTGALFFCWELTSYKYLCTLFLHDRDWEVRDVMKDVCVLSILDHRKTKFQISVPLKHYYKQNDIK